MKKIVMVFDKRGGVKTEAFGFSGSACLQATKDIEDAIGKVTGRKMKNGPDTVEAVQEVKL